MQKMRKKYEELVASTNSTIEVETLPVEEVELVNSKIEEIASIMSEIKKPTGQSEEESKSIIKESREKAKNVFEKVEVIDNFQITIEQAETLYDLLNRNQLDNLSMSQGDTINTKIKRARDKILKKMLQAIERKSCEVEDIEELNKINNKLTKVISKNPMLVTSIIYKISSKISNLQKKAAIDRVRNDVPAEIKNLIHTIADGTVNMSEAKNIIEQEARKRENDGQKNNFSLTIEQQKKKLLQQMGTIMTEKSEQYELSNPENTILQLQELCDGEQQIAINAVFGNLIRRKEFDRAKDLCKKFTYDVEDELIPIIKSQKVNIRNAEISDLVMKGINGIATEIQDEEYFNLLESRLKEGNIKMTNIYLGESQDGLRKITLADIWPSENIIVR